MFKKLLQGIWRDLEGLYINDRSPWYSAIQLDKLLLNITTLPFMSVFHTLKFKSSKHPAFVVKESVLDEQSTRSRRKKGCVIPTWECFNNYFL